MPPTKTIGRIDRVLEARVRCAQPAAMTAAVPSTGIRVVAPGYGADSSSRTALSSTRMRPAAARTSAMTLGKRASELAISARTAPMANSQARVIIP